MTASGSGTAPQTPKTKKQKHPLDPRPPDAEKTNWPGQISMKIPGHFSAQINSLSDNKSIKRRSKPKKYLGIQPSPLGN
jgi:hypothetical protein